MAPMIAKGGLLSLILLLSACSRLPGQKSARAADFDALRKELATATLSPTEVRKLARETLSAEVVRAKDRKDRPFIDSLRACSRPLFSALESRSETHDGVGAEAALLLVEAGRVEGAFAKFADETDGAWRALAARASRNHPKARRKYFTDDDERVRRTALLAALEAADPNDVKELLEVSRVDPDPLTRNRAYQVLARIGGQRVTLALKDRFSVGDEESRLAIVDAWGKPGLYNAGGRAELTRLLTHENGFDALQAATILARDSNETLRNQALTRLVRFTEDGTAEERRMALRMLPGNEPVTVKQLLVLTAAEDEQVALIAWARLLGNPTHRADAQNALMRWARANGRLAYQARAALSATGDAEILPWMKKQMTDTRPENRKVAGFALVRLGALTELAPLLADEDPDVRREIACRTLARPLLSRN